MAVDKLVDSAQLDTDLTSIANAIRTKGGTSATLVFPTDFVSAINAISTGGYLPSSAELVATASETINLSSDTSWDSWTPSTTNTEIKAVGTTRDACNYTISGENNCRNLSTIGIASYTTHYEYDTTPTAGYQLARVVYCIGYYTPIQVPEFSTVHYGISGVMVVPRQIYRTSSTVLTYASGTYGIGPSTATFSSSSTTSTSSRTVGFTSPAINARCHDTYFTTTAAGNIVSDDSYIQCEYRIWALPKEDNLFYRAFDLTNGIIWS